MKSANWVCPSCGGVHTRAEINRQPHKWIAEKPEAIQNGVRSFWITGFSSPWLTWEYITTKFLQAESSPHRLQPVFNTLMGRLWEDRGDLEDEETLLARREEYQAEVPAKAYVLTCGVDTQGDRLEYEVVGHGLFGETWGIRRGVLPGRPDEPIVWGKLDDVIEHIYTHESGKGIKISLTFVDSGGNHSQSVKDACHARLLKRVFTIKGGNRDNMPFTSPPTQVPVHENKNVKCWLYTLGVNAGKAKIMGDLKVQTPGANYCHFPSNDGCGYDIGFFTGLLSERYTLKRNKNGVEKWMWEKLPGHRHNEALDCRNYALAAFRVLHVDMEAEKRRFLGIRDQERPRQQTPVSRRVRRDEYDDW